MLNKRRNPILNILFTLLLFITSRGIAGEKIKVLSICPTESSKVYVVKGENEKGEKFKIISIVGEKTCIEKLQVNKVYDLGIYSAFIQITKGHAFTGFGIHDVIIDTEPENGYDTLYLCSNLDGECYSEIAKESLEK